MNTKRESSVPLVRKLLHDGIALNVTTIFTLQQAQDIVYAVKGGAPLAASPTPAAIRCRSRPTRSSGLRKHPTRVINCAKDFLKRLSLVGKDMDDYRWRRENVL